MVSEIKKRILVVPIICDIKRKVALKCRWILQRAINTKNINSIDSEVMHCYENEKLNSLNKTG